MLRAQFNPEAVSSLYIFGGLCQEGSPYLYRYNSVERAVWAEGFVIIGQTIMRISTAVLLLCSAAALPAADLTGNWLASTALPDGAARKTYFDLKEEGNRITGHIRATQFYYTITESTGGPEGFTLTGVLQDGKVERRVKYEGKLVGEELHLTTLQVRSTIKGCAPRPMPSPPMA